MIVKQGVDDVIAMLLAFSAKPEELDILMLSLTFGNVDVQRYVLNGLSATHYLVRTRRFDARKTLLNKARTILTF